jgi:hypothetical protein
MSVRTLPNFVTIFDNQTPYITQKYQLCLIFLFIFIMLPTSNVFIQFHCDCCRLSAESDACRHALTVVRTCDCESVLHKNLVKHIHRTMDMHTDIKIGGPLTHMSAVQHNDKSHLISQTVSHSRIGSLESAVSKQRAAPLASRLQGLESGMPRSLPS